LSPGRGTRDLVLRESTRPGGLEKEEEEEEEESDEEEEEEEEEDLRVSKRAAWVGGGCFGLSCGNSVYSENDMEVEYSPLSFCFRSRSSFRFIRNSSSFFSLSSNSRISSSTSHPPFFLF
jgi:hypothetical protein